MAKADGKKIIQNWRIKDWEEEWHYLQNQLSRSRWAVPGHGTSARRKGTTGSSRRSLQFIAALLFKSSRKLSRRSSAKKTQHCHREPLWSVRFLTEREYSKRRGTTGSSAVIPLVLAEVPGPRTVHLLLARPVLQVLPLIVPVLDARVLGDLPATSLGRIEGHFQVSNELIMLSLESWPISPVRRPAVLIHTLRLLEQIC